MVIRSRALENVDGYLWPKADMINNPVQQLPTRKADQSPLLSVPKKQE
jgi:hypothetical protein